MKITALIRRLRLIGSVMKKTANAIMTAILAPIDLVSSDNTARAVVLKKAERVIVILASGT
ncbi:MAG: hypothetical protein RQ842_09510 [Vulcanisaeta sp.]|nr:hypothetical protein [Vulcanisaeta sp.]